MNIPRSYYISTVYPPNPDIRRYIEVGLARSYELPCEMRCSECAARVDVIRVCPKCGITPAAFTCWGRCACGMWLFTCTGPVVSIFVDVSEMCNEIDQTHEDTI